MADTPGVGRVEHLEDAGRQLEELDLAHRRAALEPVLEQLSREQLHDEVRGAGAGARRDHVVVEHLNDPGVLDEVRRVALAPEALGNLLVTRQLGVEDLDGGPRPVAVAGLVHGCHAADAKERLNRPLLAENATDALASQLVEVVQLSEHRSCPGKA